MSTPLRLLIAEDSEDDAFLLIRELQRGGFIVEFERVETVEALRTALDTQPWDLILSDHSMPHLSGIQALQIAKEKAFDVPFIIVSGTISEDVAVEVMKAGAHDYISKGKIARLLPAVQRELDDALVRKKQNLAEMQLRQVENRFSKVFHASPVATSIMTMADLIFVDVNESFISIFGYPPEEIIGHSERELGILANSVERDQLEHLVQKQGSLHQVEMKVRTRTGQFRDVLASLEMLELGQEACILCMFHDITERKQAERAERDQRQFAEALGEIASTINGTLELDEVLERILVHVHRVVPYDAATIMLCEADCVVTLRQKGHIERGVSEASLDRVGATILHHAKVRHMVEGRQPILIPDVTTSTDWLTPADDLKWIRSYVGAPLFFQDRLLGLINLDSATPHAFSYKHAVRLMTFADQAAVAVQNARHAAELELRVAQRTHELAISKERNEAILKSSSNPIILLSVDGNIELVNPAFMRMFGFQSDEVIGHSLSIIARPETVNSVCEAFQNVVCSRQPIRLEIKADCKNRAMLDAELILSAISNGDVVGIVCIVHDISERKRIEEELRRSLEHEKELNELRSRFSSMISHEFRNPLSIIYSSTDILRTYGDRVTEQRKREHIEQIHQQVDRLVRLLDDYLLIRKLDRDEPGFCPELVNLASLCQEIITELQLTAGKRHLELRANPTLEHVLLDIKLMRQVITNLLSNALKYSAEGTTIQLRVEIGQATITLQVKDQGIGIPEEDQQQLFKAFHRARNVGSIQGTGLGLCIVKRAVELHGGTISCESKVNVGSTFTVLLPISQAVPSEGHHGP